MRRLTWLTLGLIAASAAVACALAVDTAATATWQAAAGLLLFATLNVVAESKPLHLPGLKGPLAEITISGLSSYALVTLFPPLPAAVAGGMAVLVSEALLKRKAAVKVAFNSSQTFLSLVAAASAYSLLTPHLRLPSLAALAIGIACAALAYFLVNTFLVSFGMACLSGTPVLRTWAGSYGWEILYVVCSVPVAMLLVVAYQRLWVAGPLLCLGPLFLLREAYAQYIRMRTNYTETVRTFVKVIETQDTYTAGHSLRVAEYAKRLAQARNLSVKDVERIEIAAYLHDLGKVHLAITEVVKKNGPLTDEERERIKLHPLVSADLAAQVTLFRGSIEEIIRYHHEHYNGSGYPYGLSGDDIPLGARILHIADAFDAMTTSRVYRGALAFDWARTELVKHSGTQFDPVLVETFLSSCARDESNLLPQVEAAEELPSVKQYIARSQAAVRRSDRPGSPADGPPAASGTQISAA